MRVLHFGVTTSLPDWGLDGWDRIEEGEIFWELSTTSEKYMFVLYRRRL